jgi:hypothetical protein
MAPPARGQVFTLLDTLVYLGALRVGQLYLNPLGEDDDDYEVVAFFNRNLRSGHRRQLGRGCRVVR